MRMKHHTSYPVLFDEERHIRSVSAADVMNGYKRVRKGENEEVSLAVTANGPDINGVYIGRSAES